MEPFSRDILESALRELSLELRRLGVRAHLYLVGGAAMAMGFDDRRHTMDVDVLIKEGHGPVTAAVRRIGRRRGWPETWLNEQAAAAIPRGRDDRARTVYGDRNLVVTAASPEHLLAMKVRAARPKDRGDIELLVDQLGLGSVEEVFDVHDSAFPLDPPGRRSFGRACRILKRLWPGGCLVDYDQRYGSPAERRTPGRGSEG